MRVGEGGNTCPCEVDAGGWKCRDVGVCAMGLLALHQEVVQLSEGKCGADKLNHACDCLRVSVKMRVLVGSSEKHSGIV